MPSGVQLHQPAACSRSHTSLTLSMHHRAGPANKQHASSCSMLDCCQPRRRGSCLPASWRPILRDARRQLRKAQQFLSFPPAAAAAAAAASSKPTDDAPNSTVEGIPCVEEGIEQKQMAELPQARPLRSVAELLSWRPGQLPHEELCRATVSLPQGCWDASPCPKLLVCHDMAGGYGEDRFPLGGGNAGTYTLTHWHCIDAFIYFSHTLVTIPPPGWIDAAHTHGVPVLGTFITEWEAGTAACAELFGSTAGAELCAAQLAAIAGRYGFEGWLINIENDLPKATIPHLLHFLRHLTALMHELCGEDGRVVWYDAVTVAGKLQWQDTLNHRNRPFFDACDAIFVNYAWTAATPSRAAKEAGGRAGDVYMGVDVFGRNTYGGGGMNCDIAIQAAREAGLSAALFAPAWVWEEGERSSWRQRQQAFWAAVAAARALPHPTSRQLPFYSCFNQGAGHATWHEGQLTRQESWYNLSRQTLQPLFQVETFSAHDVNRESAGRTSQSMLRGSRMGEGRSVVAEVTMETAFSGGSCLKLSGHLDHTQAACIPLFCTNIPVGKEPTTVRYTAALQAASSQLCLLLQLSSPSSRPSDSKLLVLTEKAEMPGAVTASMNSCHPGCRLQLRQSQSFELRGPVSLAGAAQGRQQLGRWCTWGYQLPAGTLLEEDAITGISVVCWSGAEAELDNFSAYLGEVKIHSQTQQAMF